MARHLRSEGDLGLEQHPAAECDLVGAEELAGRTCVDGDSEAGAKVPLAAQREFGVEADGAIAGVPVRVHRGEDVRLELRLPEVSDAVASIAQRQISAAFNSGFVQ